MDISGSAASARAAVALAAQPDRIAYDLRQPLCPQADAAALLSFAYALYLWLIAT